MQQQSSPAADSGYGNNPYQHERFDRIESRHNYQQRNPDSYSVQYKFNDGSGHIPPFYHLQNRDGDNATPADMATKNNEEIINTGSSIRTFENLNIHGDVMNAPSVKEAIGSIVGTTLGRNQFINDTNQTNAGHWEKSGSHRYHYAYFPVERTTYNHRTRTTTKRGMFYCVLYSSFNPWTSVQNPQKGVTLPLNEPQFAEYTTVGNSQNAQGEKLNVDLQYISGGGSLDNFKSLEASLNNCHPENGWYLSFFPMVTADRFMKDASLYEQGGFQGGASAAWSISGASLGLAVIAAVTGMASVSYSSFIRYLAPNHILESRGKGQDDVLVDTKVQINFLEHVDALPIKVAAAADSNSPLIIPSRDLYLRPIGDKKISQVAAMMGSSVIPRVRTMAEIIDGVDFSTSQRGSVIGMAATLQDAMCLGGFYWLLFMQKGKFAGGENINEMLNGIEKFYDDAKAARKQRALAEWQSKKNWQTKFAENPQEAKNALITYTMQKAEQLLQERKNDLQKRYEREQARANDKMLVAKLRGENKADRYTKYFDPNARGDEVQKQLEYDILTRNKAIHSALGRNASREKPRSVNAVLALAQNALGNKAPRLLYPRMRIPIARAQQQPYVLSQANKDQQFRQSRPANVRDAAVLKGLAERNLQKEINHSNSQFVQNAYLQHGTYQKPRHIPGRNTGASSIAPSMPSPAAQSGPQQQNDDDDNNMIPTFTGNDGGNNNDEDVVYEFEDENGNPYNVEDTSAPSGPPPSYEAAAQMQGISGQEFGTGRQTAASRRSGRGSRGRGGAGRGRAPANTRSKGKMTTVRTGAKGKMKSKAKTSAKGRMKPTTKAASGKKKEPTQTRLSTILSAFPTFGKK